MTLVDICNSRPGHLLKPPSQQIVDLEGAVGVKRENIRRVPDGHELGGIWNVDAVYMVHTPVDEPLRSANMNWIDTKCFRTGVLTIEELK